MANTRNDGTVYIKNVVGVDVPATGDNKVIFGKAIPPWMVVKRYWVHLWMTGKDEMDPFSKQNIVVSGRMANMDLDISDLANAASHDTMEKMAAIYCPRGMGQENLDGDEDDLGNVELYGTGLGKMSRFAREREWLRYEALLGLGGKAIMTNSNKIRYTAEHTTRGTVSGHGCNSDVFRFIFIDVNTREFSSDINQDVQTHVFGASTANADGLMQEAYYFFGEQGTGNIAQAEGGGLTSASNWYAHTVTPSGSIANVDELDTLQYGQSGILGPWMSTGFGTSSASANEGSGFDTDCQINVQAKVTLECKLIKPRATKVWSPD